MKNLKFSRGLSLLKNIPLGEYIKFRNSDVVGRVVGVSAKITISLVRGGTTVLSRDIKVYKQL